MVFKWKPPQNVWNNIVFFARLEKAQQLRQKHEEQIREKLAEQSRYIYFQSIAASR